jgi:hypothetical protein
VISRRELLTGAGAAALAFGIPVGPIKAFWHGSAGSSPVVGGLAQVNLTPFDPESYGQDYPFIDCMRASTCWLPFGTTANTDVFSAMNSQGIPTSMIGGTSTWRSSIAVYIPSSGSQWCFDYDGSATIGISGGGGAGQPGINVQQVAGSPPAGALANATLFSLTGVNASDVTFSATFAPDGSGNTIMTVTGATNGTVWPGQRFSGSGLPSGLVIQSAQGSTTQGNNGTHAVCL